MKKLLFPLLLAALTTAHAENILGQTTPFSKSQACGQVNCKMLSETKVGPYVVYTYSGKTTQGEQGNYFSIKKNEKNVALGVYYRNGGGAAGDYDEQFAQIEAPNVAKLLGLKAPAATALKSGGFSVPVGQNTVISDKSALNLKQETANRAAISVVYAAQEAEAAAVARLLNREDTAGKKRVIAEFKQGLGASGECNADKGFVGKNGKPLKVDAQNYSYLIKWLNSTDKRGMVWANGLGTGTLLVPGLSSTTITPTFNVNDNDNPKSSYGDVICLQ